MTGGPLQLPDRAQVQRIINDVAAAYSVSGHSVACGGRGPRVVEARHAAIVRILRETGCSEQGLATSWGISDCTIRNAKARLGFTGEPRIYDRNTFDRLTWQHGEDRACEIAAGRDAATNVDIAAWRNLGRGVA